MSAAEKPSYSKIHYLLRPAKNIQRKMICETLQHLNRYFSIKNYRYIGFGSIYFGDFSLFHRVLGITDMISIEANRDDEERVRFNAPYSCIDVKMGKSNDRIPEIPLAEKPWILWLDYDFSIDWSVLQDVKYAAANALPGSFLAVTVDVDWRDLEKIPRWAPEDDVPKFEQMKPREKLEYKLQRTLEERANVRGEAFAETCRQFLETEIGTGVAANYGFPGLPFHQLLNFRYADGHKMMTIGGVFAEEMPEGLIDFPFFRGGQEPRNIIAPQLTHLEIRRLNQELPTGTPSQVPISPEDFSDYRDVYRYFPSFSEVEL